MGGHGPGTRRSSACRRGGGAGPEQGQRAHGPSTRHAASRARVCGPVWPGSSRDLNASEAGGRSRLCHGLPASLMRRSSKALAPDELGSYPQLTSLGPHKPAHRSNLVPPHLSPTPNTDHAGPHAGPARQARHQRSPPPPSCQRTAPCRLQHRPTALSRAAGRFSSVGGHPGCHPTNGGWKAGRPFSVRRLLLTRAGARAGRPLGGARSEPHGRGVRAARAVQTAGCPTRASPGRPDSGALLARGRCLAGESASTRSGPAGTRPACSDGCSVGHKSDLPFGAVSLQRPVPPFPPGQGHGGGVRCVADAGAGSAGWGAPTRHGGPHPTWGCGMGWSLPSRVASVHLAPPRNHQADGV